MRSSPKKIYDYEPGQTVYFWRKGMERGRKRKPPVSHHGYLVKACPEHLRSATNDEKFILTDYIADIMDSKNDSEKNKARGFEPPQGQAPKFRLTAKTKHEDVIFKYSEPGRMRTEDQSEASIIPEDQASNAYSPMEFGEDDKVMMKDDIEAEEPAREAEAELPREEGEGSLTISTPDGGEMPNEPEAPRNSTRT